MKKTLFIVILTFIIGLISAQACLTPANNMTINQSETLCYGTYDLSAGGLIVNSDNIVIDCNNSVITGSFDPETETGSVALKVISHNNITINNCIFNNHRSGIRIFDSNNIYVNNYKSNVSLDAVDYSGSNFYMDNYLISQGNILIRGNNTYLSNGYSDQFLYVGQNETLPYDLPQNFNLINDLNNDQTDYNGNLIIFTDPAASFNVTGNYFYDVDLKGGNGKYFYNNVIYNNLNDNNQVITYCYNDLDNLVYGTYTGWDPNNAECCLIPVSDMVINETEKLCNGLYNVKNIIVSDGANLYFSDNTILNYTNNESTAILNLQGNNILDCADSYLFGNMNYDIQGVNVNGDNVNILNCKLDNFNTGIPANSVNNLLLSNVYLGENFAVRSLRFYDVNNVDLSYIEDHGSSRLSGDNYLIYNSTFINDISLGFVGSGLSGNINNNILGGFNVFYKHETQDLYISDNTLGYFEVVNNQGDYTTHNLHFFSNIVNDNIVDDPLNYTNNEYVDYCFNGLYGNLGSYVYSGSNPNNATCPAVQITGPAATILNLFIFLFIVAGLIMASGGFESLMDGSRIKENLVRLIMILVFSMILQTFISTALGL